VPADVETLLAEGAPPPGPAPSPEPLFAPGRERAVLSTLAAVIRPGAEVDMAAVVDRIAAHTPIGRLPRRAEPSIRLGARVLVDQGEGMRPFTGDVRLLVEALRLVVGLDSVEAVAVTTGPGGLRAVRARDGDEPLAGVLPAAGRPILACTDLGIGHVPGLAGTVGPEGWLELAAAARTAGSPLVFLVPYPSARWPDWAARARLTTVQWDRPTDAGRARRAAFRVAAHTGRHGSPP